MLELLGTELKVKYVSLGFRSPPAQAILSRDRSRHRLQHCRLLAHGFVVMIHLKIIAYLSLSIASKISDNTNTIDQSIPWNWPTIQNLHGLDTNKSNIKQLGACVGLYHRSGAIDSRCREEVLN